MSQTYNGGGFSVTIGDDGAILVKPGDSVSKYSMAIHGDFHHLQEYRRKIGGQYQPLANINVINAGETLYHEPSLPTNGHVVVSTEPDPLPKLPSGEYDINKILLDNNIPMKYRDEVTWTINSMRGAQATIAFIGMFATLNAGVALANSIAGPILGIVGGLYSIWKARNFGIQTAGLRGTVYGSVAWAFDDPAPLLPSNMEQLILAGNSSGDIENYRQVFEQAGRQSFSQMRGYALQQGLDEADLKIAIRAFGKGQPEQLAAAMMVDVADYYYSGDRNKRTAFLQPWSWYPNDRYSGRPNYLPEISQGYGWG